jgi:geranylgeranyl pyrophosphate synthase
MTTACAETDRLWYIPFLGQLTDDCRDFNDDVKSLSVTPYTYYADQIKRNKGFRMNSLLNPFYMFLNLCSDIYLSSNRDVQTGAFLGRRIARTLRSIEITKDEIAYRQFLNVFCADNSLLHDYFWNKLRRRFSSIADPEKNFFRALDSLSVRFSRTNRKLETYVFENIPQIEDALNIDPMISQQLPICDTDVLISAMNYSVKAGGKRLRMLLLLIVADLYEIETRKILPLACGIEYLHTSSLIFDDLPAQDNSDLRRGRPTLHKTTINDDIPETLCEGRAQLAAVSLIAVSMSIIINGLTRNGFSAQSINRIIDEISQLMHSLCVGQMMDLRAAHVGMTVSSGQVEKLDRVAWLKTGKTIEAVLITPVILSDRRLEDQNTDIARLRELSRLIGILYQMRDDLLDVEANDTIGKPTALDVKNNTVTYVSVLGVDGTRHRLQQYLTQTLQLLDECWPTDAETLKDVVRHIVSRTA